jgi:hypothetical protein
MAMLAACYVCITMLAMQSLGVHHNSAAGVSQTKNSSTCTVPTAVMFLSTDCAHDVVRTLQWSCALHCRALLCGAGRSMREGCLAASSHGLQQCSTSTGPQASAGCHASSLNGQLVVDLPYTAQQLSALLAILYEHNLEVRCCIMCRVDAFY